MKYLWLFASIILFTACNTKIKQANKRGLEYMKQNLYEQAITEFNTIIHNEPEWFPAYYNRAIAKMALSQGDEALKDLEIASRLGFEQAGNIIRSYFHN